MVQAQNINIIGQVTDLDGMPLAGATINYDNKKGTIADTDGNFHIQTPANSEIRLIIRYIGYETIDTIITPSETSELYVQFKMKQELFELPNIEITADYQNIFDGYKFHIIDFTISNDLFYLIVKKGQNSFICQANINGTILEEHELQGGYSKFHNSCLGGIILVGRDFCAELHTLDGKLFITNEFSIDYYDKYIVPCKLKMEEALVFKNISHHNKRIDYLQFKKDENPEVLYTVYDQEGEAVSQSYYAQLMREYHKETGSASLEDIDHGFDRQNIINDGSWNGDLQDLITTNTTHYLVLQYQALGLKEVKSDLFVADGKPYVFDAHNMQVVELYKDEKGIDISSFDLDEDTKIISDNVHHTFFESNHRLYEVEILENAVNLKAFKKIDHCYFKERDLIHKGILYRLGRKSMGTVRKTIFRDSLDD